MITGFVCWILTMLTTIGGLALLFAHQTAGCRKQLWISTSSARQPPCEALYVCM
jgi:hypothetical protein